MVALRNTLIKMGWPQPPSPIQTIAQIIKFVMTSAAEAELGALFTTAQKNGRTTQHPHRNGLATIAIANTN